MEEDIVPGLLESIKTTFRELYDGSSTVAALLEKVQAGTATYAQAQEYAIEVSRLIGEAWGKYISSAALPDGRMYYNIASRLIPSVLDNNHALVADYAAKVQQQLNRQAGIGIRAQVAPVNTDRENGLVNLVSNQEKYDDVSAQLKAAMENFSQAVVDSTLKENVGFQGRAGLTPRIIRRAESGACKWCRALVGVYDYPDVPEDVYRRHESCRCVVEYDTGSGKRQNVHTKKWTDPDNSVKINTRKEIGLKTKQRQFQSDALLQKHFEKHVEEFGAISIPEYLQRANTLADRELSNDVVSLLRSDGSTSKYCFSTNEFVIINADGTIRTYFKPEAREAYWQYELDRN